MDVSTAIASEVADRLGAIGMDEQQFLLFYSVTARPLKAYLVRMLRDAGLADDILQESYLRILKAKLPANMDGEHRKNYLFRIATNLLHQPDAFSRRLPLESLASPAPHPEREDQRRDVQKIFLELKPRERELLWLAYVERFSHAEIAGVVGAKSQSIRPMLARARDKLADLLIKHGFKSLKEKNVK
jgi:RNA polymerase sigma-70 factor (ECF subfamily)